MPDPIPMVPNVHFFPSVLKCATIVALFKFIFPLTQNASLFPQFLPVQILPLHQGLNFPKASLTIDHHLGRVCVCAHARTHMVGH